MKIPRNQYRISIISACNMKCVYCHNEGNIKYNKLSKEDIEKIIINSKEFDLKEIRLTGGDPMIHPDIIEICKMIKDKYGLKIGINTNCVKYDDLLYLSKNNYIDRIVVGLDYFDGNISKNSPIGIPSRIILSRIKELSNYVRDISIDIVYFDNENDIYNIIDWGIKNKIRIKVIEIVKNEICNTSSKEYLELMEKIINKFKLHTKYDENGELNGYINNDLIVSFFWSLCRMRKCDICKKIQLRINCEGIAKPCIFYDDQDVNLLNDNIYDNIKKVLERKIEYHYDKGLIVNGKK